MAGLNTGVSDEALNAAKNKLKLEILSTVSDVADVYFLVHWIFFSNFVDLNSINTYPSKCFG